MPARGHVWLGLEHGTTEAESEPTRATRKGQTPRSHPGGPAAVLMPQVHRCGPRTAPCQERDDDVHPATKLALPKSILSGPQV
jgi:hypothetical protein